MSFADHTPKAALFSAVVTTFVVQSSQALLPDYAQISTFILEEQVALLRAINNITAVSEGTRSPLGPESLTRSSIDIWINGLFFASLCLSIVTALLSVLVKQWLQVSFPPNVNTNQCTNHFLRHILL